MKASIIIKGKAVLLNPKFEGVGEAPHGAYLIVREHPRQGECARHVVTREYRDSVHDSLGHVLLRLDRLGREARDLVERRVL